MPAGHRPRRPADGSRRRSASRTDDRPYVVILLALLVVIGAMALGPVRNLADANDRVEQLTAERDVLAADVDRLEGERDALNDPAEQERYAREQLGLVRPGEQPYIVLPDEDGGPRLDGAVPAPGDPAAPSGAADADSGSQAPWYRRLLEAVGSVFDR